MTTTHIILLLNAFIKVTASPLQLYSITRAVIALALWRRRLLRGLNNRRGQ